MWPKVIAVLMVVLVLPLAAVVLAILWNRPMLLDPPGPAQRLSIYLRHNTAETVSEPLLPELRIRRYPVSFETMKEKIERTLADLPRWRLLSAERDLGVYHAEATTPLWRFRDDVYIMANPSAGGRGEVEVYVHSASRIGRGDLGANRHHILQFYEALEAQWKRES